MKTSAECLVDERQITVMKRLFFVGNELSSLVEDVVTCLLHDFVDAQVIHLRHGEHLHAQELQDVTGNTVGSISIWTVTVGVDSASIRQL